MTMRSNLLVLALFVASLASGARADDPAQAARSLLSEGEAHERAGRVRDAIESYTRATEAAPDDAFAHASLAAALAGAGAVPRAVVHFERGSRDDVAHQNLTPSW